MSFMRSAVPVVLAVGLGIFNAQYIFKPALENEARKRDQHAIDKELGKPVVTTAKTPGAEEPVAKS